MDIENLHNPHDERRVAIHKWKSFSVTQIVENSVVLANANYLLKFGIKPKDALHVASAVDGKANYFLTTDDKLLYSIKKSSMLEGLNPVDFVKVVDK